MSVASKWVRVSVAMAGLASVGVVYQLWSASDLRGALSRAQRERESLQRKIAATETHLQTERERLAAVEADNGRLLDAIAAKAAAAPARAARPRLTPPMVNERYRHAQSLAEKGDPAGALAEFLWCYDAGFRNPGDVLARVLKLAESFPPARDALLDRRAKAEQRVLSSEDDMEAMIDVIAFNRVLGENDRTLEIYDRLPPGDPRHVAAESRMFDMLITSQRYREALNVFPYERMLPLFEYDVANLQKARAAPPPVAVEDQSAQMRLVARERAHDARRRAIAEMTSLNIEVLAGSGAAERARELARKLLIFDSSPETQALVQKHIERAGQPELLK